MSSSSSGGGMSSSSSGGGISFSSNGGGGGGQTKSSGGGGAAAASNRSAGRKLGDVFQQLFARKLDKAFVDLVRFDILADVLCLSFDGRFFVGETPPFVGRHISGSICILKHKASEL